MILIFDLDDTLYDESTYVESGFRAVAAHGERTYGWKAAESFAAMMSILDRHGRGAVFDQWLQLHGKGGVGRVRECVDIYRHHTPRIRLQPGTREMLRRLRRRHRLYVVTDGHKVVQAKKVAALKLDGLMEKVFITHRYGVRRAKPATYCFERIKEREDCEWSDLMYVGDNPAKDFVGLKPLGAQTVRVLTGMHSKVRPAKRYDARHTIPTLERLEPLLETLER